MSLEDIFEILERSFPNITKNELSILASILVNLDKRDSQRMKAVIDLIHD